MWTVPLLKTKAKAMLVHMSLSLVIFVPMLYMILSHWYQGPLFFTDGGWQGVRLMLLVDVVLGPSLTFLIFNPAKSRLALGVDFSFIGVAQAIALVYGIHAVQSSSIQAIVFSQEGEFRPVVKTLFAEQEIPVNGWARFGDQPQYWVYMHSPNAEEVGGIVAAAFINSTPDYALFYLYDPLTAHKDDVRKRALDMPQLAAIDPQFKKLYEVFLDKHKDQADKLSFYPMVGGYGEVVIALDPDLNYVGFINYKRPRLHAAPALPAGKPVFKDQTQPAKPADSRG